VKKIFILKSSLSLNIFFFCLGCIYYYYYFFAPCGYFSFFFHFACHPNILFVLSKIFFSCTVVSSFLFSVFISFGSNYLNDVAQFNFEDLISSSLSSFSTTITDHVLFFCPTFKINNYRYIERSVY